MSDLPHYQTIPELGIKGRMDTTKEYDLIGLPADLTGKRVLDIGCNAGAFMFECLKRHASFVQGIDHNPQWTERAKATMDKAKETLGNTEQIAAVMTADATDVIPLFQEKFDLILCLSVTHLIPNPNTLVVQCIEALKEGGLLILEINHRLEKEKVVLNDNFKTYGRNKDNRSVYHFVKNSA